MTDRDMIITLKEGREKAVLRGHPWIFSGALLKEPVALAPGSPVRVHSQKGRFLAHGYYNPHSQIRVRVVGLKPDETWERRLIMERISAAIARRRHLKSEATSALRLVSSEADLLPGIIVDCYGDAVVMQLLTSGADLVRQDVIDALTDQLNPRILVERSDDRAGREREGLKERKELVRGPQDGLVVTCRENGMEFLVDLWQGQKTGFYCDQRDNRAIVASYAAAGRVLNLFCYTGGFTVACLRAGAAEVVNVDASSEALALGAQNLERNGLTRAGAATWITADVFSYQRQLVAQGEKFDLVIVDPPKFVTNKAHLTRATRGYKDLNMHALRLLRPGGLLATFSCSGLVDHQLFWQIVFGAAADTGDKLQVLRLLQQAEDHPPLINFPESLYLKGLLCRKI